MNNYSPDIMYQLENARLEDIRNAATTHNLAQIAQSDQPNRFKSIVNGIATFAKQIRPGTVEMKQTSEVPQVQLGN